MHVYNYVCTDECSSTLTCTEYRGRTSFSINTVLPYYTSCRIYHNIIVAAQQAHIRNSHPCQVQCHVGWNPTHGSNFFSKKNHLGISFVLLCLVFLKYFGLIMYNVHVYTCKAFYKANISSYKCRQSCMSVS